MRLFHNENDVGPGDEFVRQRIVGIVICAGRRDFEVFAAEKICSAVGLRRRFWLHTNRTFFIATYRAKSATTASSTIMPDGVARSLELPIGATSPSSCSTDSLAGEKPLPDSAS